MVKCKHIKTGAIKRIEGSDNKKMKQKIKKIVEKMAVKAAKMQVDSTCKWMAYQPKESEVIKKLRKH